MSDLKDINIHIGTATIGMQSRNQISKVAFAQDVIDFLSDFSSNLIEKIKAGNISDEYLYFGMWIRRKNLEKFVQKYQDKTRRGYGNSLHIAPSNVPTNALFTLAFGLLTGNVCFVRISENLIKELKPVFKTLQESLENHETISRYILFFSSNYHSKVLKNLIEDSELVIVWGGTKTVQTIKKQCVNPYQKFLGFPDRTSLSIISINYLKNESKGRQLEAATSYARDLYFFGQRACSSPRLLIAYNPNQIKEWREYIDHFLYMVSQKGNNLMLQNNHRISRYNSFNSISRLLALNSINERLCTKFNNLFIYDAGELKSEQIGNLSQNGCIAVKMIKNLQEMPNLIAYNAQTISYNGLSKEELSCLVGSLCTTKIARIVKFGNTLNMGAVWDGYDLIYEMSRVLSHV